MSSTSTALDAATIEARAQRGLRISVIDGCLYAVMVGASESYVAAMAVELGHRDTALALLLTLPMLIGSLCQLLAGPIVALLGARKRLVLIAAYLQATSVLGLYLIAEHGVRELWPLLLVDTLYFVCALILGPAWGAWMANLTEGRQRERYFARRSGWLQVWLLFSFVAAGLALQNAGDDPAAKLHTFAVLHLCGFVFRLFSASMLALQPDLEVSAERRNLRQSVAAIRTALHTAEFGVPAYLALLMLGTHIAVPFFTPYMLRDLQLDYATYASLTAVPIVVKALLFPALHPLSQRYGMRKVLVWSAAGVVTAPALWVVLDTVPGLVLVQMLSGLAWGGLEFASFQLLLSSARPDCRVEYLSIASTMSSTTQLIGGLGAGLLRTQLGWSYATLFMLSSLGRGLALLWIVGALPRRMRVEMPRLFLRVISLRPGTGTLQRPIVHDDPTPESDAKQGAQGETRAAS
jgi:MFS family permease